ncbi:MAG: arsenate reductase ArsC [Acidimicrobiia bacterium]|nr:arsenate reductase ArsC [Acidimicrobiia bacterium]
MSARPQVLFVCVHNAGRSQMAAALTEMHGQGLIDVRSAGSEPADRINPVAVEAMAELGIEIRTRQPKLLADDTVRASDVVITMGCGDACPVYPGTRYFDWVLDDPAGKDLDAVRKIRDDINRRVLDLVHSLLSDGRDWERPTALQPD